MKLVVVDADVLGRRRTGDETYVRNLLAELAPLASVAGVRIAGVTRRPDLLPEGIEPIELSTSVQQLRMAWTLPQVLRRQRAALAHTQYALPLRAPCPCVVTVHDLSFAHRPDVMGRKDRVVFRAVVPQAVKHAARVFTVSERTKRDLVETYRADPARIVVTPNGVDPVFYPSPSEPTNSTYALTVGSIEKRKNQLAALDGAAAAGLPLVVAGPERDAALATELRRRGARLEGYVEQERLAELYRGAACLVQASLYEGFGLPVLEAMASGTPVVAVREAAVQEIGGDAVVFAEEGGLATAIRRALDERERLVAAGLERASHFSWRASAERTLATYLEVLS